MRFFALLACLCAALFFLPASAAATDVVQSWSQTFQSTGGESPQTFTVDSKGSVYIVSTVGIPSEGFFWIIRKLNSLGQLQWSQSFFATNLPQDVAADANGNLFITGSMMVGSQQDALTVKLFANGDFGWVKEYSGGSGMAIHTDSAGNVYVGGSWFTAGPSGLLMLKFSNEGEVLNAVQRSDISPGSMFFMPNGTLVAKGYAQATTNPAMEAISSAGTFLYNSVTDNTSTDTFGYMITCDPSSNLYLLVSDNNNTNSFTVSCYGPNGSLNWLSAANTGIAESITAGDPSHVYVNVFVATNNFADMGFGSGGTRFMNVQATLELIVADGAKGLVRLTQDSTGYRYSEINADLQTLWSQTDTSFPLGALGLKVINSVVYSLNQSDLNDTDATQFLKFVQGVGVTAVTPAAPSIQGGKSVNITVQLNDVAPAGGLPAYFVSSSSALGLPASVVIPAGKSTFTVTALTDPVDVPTSVSIAAEVNGGVRTTTVTLNPAVLSTVTFPGGTSASVVGGQTITGTIALTGPTALLAHTVTLSSNNAKATVPATVNVLAGASSATFVVHTTAVSASTPVVITAKLAGITVTAELTVAP